MKKRVQIALAVGSLLGMSTVALSGCGQESDTSAEAVPPPTATATVEVPTTKAPTTTTAPATTTTTEDPYLRLRVWWYAIQPSIDEISAAIADIKAAAGNEDLHAVAAAAERGRIATLTTADEVGACPDATVRGYMANAWSEYFLGFTNTRDSAWEMVAGRRAEAFAHAESALSHTARGNEYVALAADFVNGL